MYIHIYAYMYIYVFMYICIYTFLCIYVYKFIYVYIHTCARASHMNPTETSAYLERAFIPHAIWSPKRLRCRPVALVSNLQSGRECQMLARWEEWRKKRDEYSSNTRRVLFIRISFHDIVCVVYYYLV